MKVNIKDMTKRTENVFMAMGVSREDSKIITDVLMQTEMRGVYTHGFYRVPFYANCLMKKGIKAKSDIKTIKETDSWALVDGEGGLGIIISYKAMQLAIEKAKKTGIGIVNVRGSHHFGAAGYYTKMCADEKMVGVSMSNGDVLVAATGSREKTIGNNPFSYSAPAGKFGDITYDIAMSYSSDKKIIKMAEEGQKLPAGWLIDKNGNETTDPAEYEKGGVLMPFGGYKGYGLAMMVEVMAAAMSGAAMTTNVHAWNAVEGTSGNVGHMFVAMDVSKIYDKDVFEKNIENMIDQIKSSKKAEGVEKIYFPGEIEINKYEACKKAGEVEIADSTMEDFEILEKSLGL